MKSLIIKVKRLVSEMESYIYCDNYDKINQLADELLNMIKTVKVQCDNADNGNNNIVNNNIANKIAIEYPGLTLISTLTFLYKPIVVKNFYDGDYLERFGLRRTEELKDAGALDLHNKFWMSNNVENGNVFGSIPLDLISKDCAKSLHSYGWEKTNVSIYELGEEVDFKELDKFCDRTFGHYIIATEMRNNTKLVLHYDIVDIAGQ